jgi:hypothetical protein
MLSFVALFVAGFEIKSPDGGVYVPPPFADAEIIQGVRRPKRDVEVLVKRREGFEEVEWGFEV